MKKVLVFCDLCGNEIKTLRPVEIRAENVPRVSNWSIETCEDCYNYIDRALGDLHKKVMKGKDSSGLNTGKPES